MGITKSRDSNIPEPAYTRYLHNQKILLDANVLLIGILFRSSHSRRLLDAIRNTNGAKAIISNHIRNVSLAKVEEKNPAATGQFISTLLSFIKNRVIDVVPDGDPALLPNGASYDPKDDDIVMATALASKCTKLVTMDRRLARVAREFLNIEVAFPFDPERSTIISPIARAEKDGTISNGLDSLKIYLGPIQGSIIMHVQPSENSTYYSGRGRRYVFCTDTGFACWLSEKEWRYEAGHRDSKPFVVFPKLNKEAPVLIGMSYDCAKKNICFEIGEGYTGDKKFRLKEQNNLTFEHVIDKEISLLSRQNGNDNFWGYFHGICTTAEHVGLKGLQYALENRSH